MALDDSLTTVAFEGITAAQASEIAQRGATSLADAPQLADAVGQLLAPALRAAPDTAAALTRRGHYVVKISASGQAALDGGAVRFLQRVDGRLQPTLVNQAGRFHENATLVGRVGQRVANVAAVANVAVLLVVQAQIVSMERSLERIEKKLDAVRKRLDDGSLAQVRGRLRALRKLRDELTSNVGADDRVRWGVALDQADTEFHQIDELAMLQCEEATRTIAAAPMNVSLFGPPGRTLAAAFQDGVDQYRRHHDLRALCLVGRIVVAHLRRAIDVPVALDDLRGDLDRLAADAVEHERLVADRAMEFTTKFSRARYEVATRRGLRDDAATFRRRADEQAQVLRRQAASLRTDAQLEVQALIEVGADGELAAVQVIEDPP